MTDWDERQVEYTEYEFEVPTPSPYGASGKDFDVVWSHATRVAKRVLAVPDDKTLSEDVLRIKPGDEGVIIWFSTKKIVVRGRKP